MFLHVCVCLPPGLHLCSFICQRTAVKRDLIASWVCGSEFLKSDYSFKSLSQVEDYVKTNGHLPGYLSAKTIKEEGVDLMKTQLTNVEKIEELYLHTIEQEKALKAKDAKIAELETRLSKIEQLLNK